MKKLFLILFALIGFRFALLAQWSNNPAENLRLTDMPGEQVIPKIRKAPNGDYYLGYFSLENGNYNVRLQRFDANGNKLWANDGILVSSHPSMSWLTDWDMAVDHENHAVLTWQDIRANENNNIVAYRIAPNGDFVWGPDGIMLSNSSAFNVAPTITITAANNAVIAWMADDVMIRQKLNAAGQKLWGENGIAMSGTARYTWPQMMPVGNDEVLMKYYEDSGPSWAPTRNLMLQRFDANGQPAWANATVVCNSGSITAWTQILPFESDGNDGCIIAWHDYRLNGNIASGWVQHINSSGQAMFPVNGTKISETDNFNKFYLQAVFLPNTGNTYVFWSEVTDDQNFYGIFAQRFNASGERLWGDSGKAIMPVSSQVVEPSFLFATGDDVILGYELFIGAIQTTLHARRYNAAGEAVWSPEEVTIASTVSAKVHPDFSKFANNQWVIVWEDDRNSDVDLFGQNLRPDGSLGAGGPMGTLSVQVNIEGNLVSPEQANIQIDSQIIHPDPLGLALIQLPEGVYTVGVMLPYAQPLTFENVQIVENNTTNLIANLLWLRGNLQIRAIDQFQGPVYEVSYSVVGPENTYSGHMNFGTDTLFNVPYGVYHGTATFGFDQNAEATAVLDSEHFEMVFVFILGGITENSSISKLRVEPNPATIQSVLHFESGKSSRAQLQIFDKAGRILGRSNMVFQTGVNRINLANLVDVSALPNGIYSLVIQAGTQKSFVKLAIAK